MYKNVISNCFEDPLQPSMSLVLLFEFLIRLMYSTCVYLKAVSKASNLNHKNQLKRSLLVNYQYFT